MWWCGFSLFDVMNDVLYCRGFLFLSISNRLLAIRVWNIRDEFLEQYQHAIIAGGDSITTAQQQERLMTFLRQARAQYEDVYEASEHVSNATGLVTLLLIALTALEMASTLGDVFQDKENFELQSMSIAEWAMVRLLIVLAAVLLQVAWTAADLYFASEKLGEVLAQCETQGSLV